MIPTIIIGGLLAVVLTWSAISTRKSMKSGKCAGCSAANCSSRK